ncbi:MAG: hypothetical protein MUF04_06890 [Akkermansiaceae bacterium]|jgi:hypothetical protein|nr:hypothetical protein [Akkermansiaceae bacterium]
MSYLVTIGLEVQCQVKTRTNNRFSAVFSAFPAGGQGVAPGENTAIYQKTGFFARL